MDALRCGGQPGRLLTVRSLSILRDEVLAALDDGGEDAVLRASIGVLRVHARSTYAIGGTPADVLRETMGWRPICGSTDHLALKTAIRRCD